MEGSGEVLRGILPVPGSLVRLDGADVQVFESSDAEAARTAAATISPDGNTVGTSMIAWVSRAHFNLAGRIIALYVAVEERIVTLRQRGTGSSIACGAEGAQPGTGESQRKPNRDDIPEAVNRKSCRSP